MFVHGIYIWGASWEKTTGELIDAPPRHGCTALPVIHVTCWPASEKPAIQVNSAVKLANDSNDIIYLHILLDKQKPSNIVSNLLSLFGVYD